MPNEMTDAQRSRLKDIRKCFTINSIQHPAGGSLVWAETSRYDFLINAAGDIIKKYEHGSYKEVRLD